MTRNDAQLQREDAFAGFWDRIETEMSKVKYSVLRELLSITTTLNSTVGIVTLLLLTILVGYGMLTLNGSINMHTVLTPIMLVGFLFTNINCGNFTSKKRGEAPWLLLANGINQKTQSIDQPQGGGSSGGGGASPLVPPTGMFFLHPDHLGSINMITDGFGNVITGGNNGGKSSINYKPYGEINRTDSSGPDITKFKYTGQEEDKESGLLYYKARYYDPALGRFLQADSIVMPESLYGMNRYMYVDGNPVKWKDPSGNTKRENFAWAAMAYLTHSQTNFGALPEHAAIAGWMVGHNLKKSRQSKVRNNYFQSRLDQANVTSQKAQKKGLDNYWKMAAIGASLNGQEGATSGFILGTLMDRKKYHRRMERMNANVEAAIKVIAFATGLAQLGTAGLYKEGVTIGKRRYFLPEIGAGLTSGTAGFATDFLITELFDKPVEQYYETKEVSKYTIMSCGISMLGHIDKNPDSNQFADGACLLGANL
jgi:RHS repeat-associated protein